MPDMNENAETQQEYFGKTDAGRLSIEEEYFRKHYPDSCYGDKPLSPYYDFFEDGVEFGERQSENKIEELERKLEQTEKDLADYQFNYPKIKELSKKNEDLEKENERLKGDLELWESGGCRATNLFECGVVKELKEQLTKAKEIIKDLMSFSVQLCDCRHTIDFEKTREQAEQFLKGENIILEDTQAGNSPFDADEVFNKEMKAYPEEKVK